MKPSLKPIHGPEVDCHFVGVSDLHQAQLAAIEAAYARREDRGLYSSFDPAHQLVCQERERQMLQLLAHHGWKDLREARILEIGCGTGAWLRQFIQWGARPENILGVDLLPARIAEASRLCPSGVILKCADARHVEAPDQSRDLILQSTVFTSVLDTNMRVQLAREMLRLLKHKGLILWYDFHVNNPRNPDVRGVTRREIHKLFPGCRIFLKRLTLAPPLGRRVARISTALYRTLSCFKPACTHYLGVIQKP
jgi:ubiquinone/menaquinone biosynthesis C-methylase UbiE